MRALIVGLVVVLCVGSALAAKAPTFAHQAAQAKAGGRLLLADFYTDWCYWCQQLDKNVYPNKRVAGLIHKYFVLAKVNAEEDTKTAAKYDINAYPTIVILDTDGTVLKRIEGYEDAKLFAADLEDAVDLQKLRAEGRTLKAELASGTAANKGAAEARMGYIDLRLGDSAGAAEWLTKAQADGVNTPDLTLNLALATKQGADLVQALSGWITANPDNARLGEATYDLGIAQEKTKDWKGALAQMNKVVAATPESYFGLKAATEVKALTQRAAEESQQAPPCTSHG